MTYKVFEPDFQKTFSLTTHENKLISDLFGDGSFTKLFRNALVKNLGSELLELNACSDAFPAGEPFPVVKRVDFLSFYGLAGVFSFEGMNLMIAHGSDLNDFVPCKIAQILGKVFFIFLPLHSFDVLDVEKSSFLSTIPASPPDLEEAVLFGITELVLKTPEIPLPGCFLLKYPSKKIRYFPEIIVSEQVRNAWRQNHMVGANFVG
jgi:hypothetical protein